MARKNSPKNNLSSVLLSFAKQTQIDRDALIEAIDGTFKKAYRHVILKKYAEKYNNKTNELLLSDITTKTVFDEKASNIHFYVIKDVRKNVFFPHKQINFKDAIKIDHNAELNQKIKMEIFVEDFATPEILQFRQVLKQKLHDITVEKVYNDFLPFKHQAVFATVENVYDTYAFVNINDYSCFLPKYAWISNEELETGKRIVVYIVDVLEKTRGSQVVVSRKHDNLLFSLLKSEVVEYEQGILEIKSHVRHPGMRSVLVVSSNDKNVLAVGSFLGVNSERIKNVSALLNDEKIEIVKYDENLSQLIFNLLYPVKIVGIKIGLNDAKIEDYQEKDDKNADPRKKPFHIFKFKATVIVNNNDLYMAIGKKGQNVRFASRLADCDINIIMESRANEEHVDYEPVAPSVYKSTKSRSTKRNVTGLESTETEDEDSLLEWKAAFHEYEEQE